jgi:ceramide glucosyltransferase
MTSFPHILTRLGILTSAAICLSSCGYYVLAVSCARSFFRRPLRRNDGFTPPITVLKPLCGLDCGAYENFASFCRQSYPDCQIVFGSDDEADPALVEARGIARDFPERDIRVVVHRGPRTPNPKVGLLATMAAEASHPLLLISDSDIRVEKDHLRRLVAPMADPEVGVVTCLYRSGAEGFASSLAALGLSTDFQPAVLVARHLEGISFGLGSGILIRRAVLDAVGGFAAIADYLSDDYLLGLLPVRAGYRAELVAEVVRHELGGSTLRGVLDRQMRWNRGIRSVRPLGYAGLFFTQGTPASLLLLALAWPFPAALVLSATTLTLRLAMAWLIAVRYLRDESAKRSLWLVPARDLLGFALWLGAFLGSSVVWRGRRFRLEANGRLVPEKVEECATSETGRHVGMAERDSATVIAGD